MNNGIGLIINGLVSAGFVEEDDQIDYLNEIFDTNLDTLDKLKDYNLRQVRDVWDERHGRPETDDTTRLHGAPPRPRRGPSIPARRTRSGGRGT